MTAHYDRGEPELGCAYGIFLVVDGLAILAGLWATLAGPPYMVPLGILALVGAVASIGGVLFGEPR